MYAWLRRLGALALCSVGFVNPFKVLGLQTTAGKEEIRSAFRRLAKEQHPDVESGDAARFRQLLWASEELSSEEGRTKWARKMSFEEKPFEEYESLDPETFNLDVDIRKPKKKKKQSFKESGRRWAERKMRASGRMSAVPENSAKVKGQRRRRSPHRPVRLGFLFAASPRRLWLREREAEPESHRDRSRYKKRRKGRREV
ncbi:unnamed protein product [Effrenium voratum]|nr:unnamed protein product [Effrenium voratum]